jgi:hypothetical protein
MIRRVLQKRTALTIIYHLLREEGLFLGLSSGINVAGAVRFARERGPGQTIVTILCDSGHKYLSTLYNCDWLAAKKLDWTLPLEAMMSLPEVSSFDCCGLGSRKCPVGCNVPKHRVSFVLDPPRSNQAVR